MLRMAGTKLRKRRPKRTDDGPTVGESGEVVSVTGRRRRIRRNQHKPWIAPDDMPLWQAREVAGGRMCGAALKNCWPHLYCRMRPAANQNEHRLPARCRLHGGAVPEHYMPGKQKVWSLKHGMYTEAMLPGEEVLLSSEVESMEAELQITKLRLARAMRAEREQREMADAGVLAATMEVESMSTRTRWELPKELEIKILLGEERSGLGPVENTTESGVDTIRCEPKRLTEEERASRRAMRIEQSRANKRTMEGKGPKLWDRAPHLVVTQKEETRTVKAVNYGEQISRLISQLQKLAAAHMLLTGGGENVTPAEYARKVREGIEDAQDATTGEVGEALAKEEDAA